MPDVSAVDSQRAFTVDPGAIRPAVLRAMWAGLHAVLPVDLAGRLDAAAGLVGLGGVWAALTQEPRHASTLVTAIRGVVEGVARDPARWRSIGSAMVAQALFIGGEAGPSPPAGTPATAPGPSGADASADQGEDAGPTHHRYQGVTVARAGRLPVVPE